MGNKHNQQIRTDWYNGSVMLLGGKLSEISNALIWKISAQTASLKHTATVTSYKLEWLVVITPSWQIGAVIVINWTCAGRKYNWWKEGTENVILITRTQYNPMELSHEKPVKGREHNRATQVEYHKLMWLKTPKNNSQIVIKALVTRCMAIMAWETQKIHPCQ